MLIIADSKIPYAESAFSQFGQVRILPTPEIINANILSADALLVRSETIIDRQLLAGSRIRFVGTATIGIDHIDENYLVRNEIAFASCPGSNANSVAEYVLAALLELGHRFGFSLKGRTLGVVGHGNTGSRTAKKAEAIGMEVLLNDPPLARKTGDVRYLPIERLMECDIVSLHVPLTKTGPDATFHLFDNVRLRAMKRGSILINTSRGGVVETMALRQALQSKHLLACVLDVWEREPDIDIELLQLAAFGTPHIAGYSYDGKLNATLMLRRALGEFLNVRPVPWNAAEAQPMQLRTTVDGCDDEVLRTLVRQCYDLRVDDANLRRLLSLLPEQRAAHFRSLRAGYRVRREFQNFSLEAPPANDSCARIFRALGFRVSQTQSLIT